MEDETKTSQEQPAENETRADQGVEESSFFGDSDAEDEELWPVISTPQAEGLDPGMIALPPVERDRPARPPIVAVRTWALAGMALAVIGLAVVAFVWVQASSLVVVPNVTGSSLALARTEISRVDLVVSVADRRFSTRPSGEVLSQSPAPGSEVEPGSVVEIVVSAGTEDFLMPDVVGDGVALARGTLEDRGLVVTIETQASDAASDTVLATTPSPGIPVRTGDVVKLVVAAGGTPAPDLRPYRLDGVVVTLDPSAVPEGPDVTMDVARRLRSLIEASGGSVVSLRSANETAGADAGTRAVRAAESSGTVAIGLDVAPTGVGGRAVTPAGTGTPAVVGQSQLLASSITSALVEVAPPVIEPNAPADTVLAATKGPWVRVRLGSLGSRPDQAAFADPTWADKVSRAIYEALGERFGAKGTP